MLKKVKGDHFLYNSISVFKYRLILEHNKIIASFFVYTDYFMWGNAFLSFLFK